MENTIYVVTHKKFDLSDYLMKNGYRLISVGKGNQEKNSGNKDNTKDNISDKNANYCELTALYWIWKNDVYSDVKGLCHYRRYFTKAIVSQKDKFFLTSQDIENYFSKGIEYILPQKSRYVRDAVYNYLKCGRRKDLDTLRIVLEEKYPSYVNDYDYILAHNWSYLNNMIITTSEHWNNYCNWLFDILFEVEKYADLTGYSKQEARVYGYMSERLLSVWILHNHYKVKEMRIVNTEERMNIGYVAREIMVKLRVYQCIKTILWKLKVVK